MNIGQAPFFKNLGEPIQIFVNPLRIDDEYTLNVENYVEMNNNPPESVKISVESELREDLMAWDEATKTLSLKNLGVDKIGSYTIKI